MGTRIVAVGADWSGKGKPNIFPFVSLSDADFAYDFRPRTTKYNDLTKKTTISLMRGTLSPGNASIAFSTDNTVGLVSADGQGLTIDNLGAAFISSIPKALALDGSVKLTAYVVGGYSGLAFPAGSQYPGSPGQTPQICNLFDYGNRVLKDRGFTIESDGYGSNSSAQFGGRVNSYNPSVGSQLVGTTRTAKCAIFLTFDGTNFTVYNATTGFTETKTVADLGITAALPVSASIVPGIGIGATGTASNAALSPTIYQIAQWSRVLSKTEMDLQYSKTRAAFSGIGI